MIKLCFSLVLVLKIKSAMKYFLFCRGSQFNISIMFSCTVLVKLRRVFPFDSLQLLNTWIDVFFRFYVKESINVVQTLYKS